VFRRFGVPTSKANNFVRTARDGNDPYYKGDHGVPWELVKTVDANGRVIEIRHHYKRAADHIALAHEFDRPHYHGPQGECIFYPQFADGSGRYDRYGSYWEGLMAHLRANAKD
jgi:hypothetical protein